METAQVKQIEAELLVSLPLTQPTGKVRVKERSFFGDYGTPVAVRQTPIAQTHYVEWQIGYDLKATDENQAKTTLTRQTFVNYKGEEKFAYELSEMLFYAVQRGLVPLGKVKETFAQIQAVNEAQTFEQLESMSICRTHPQEVSVNGMNFFKMTVSYPMLVRKFGQYDIYTEIVVREKQRAVGTQAMHYVCLPITSLRFSKPALGRTLEAKETAAWLIGTDEGELALELFRVFGMLSPKHRHDVLAILTMLFPSIA